MNIESIIWDKKSNINGKTPSFLTKHFIDENGNDDRVLIFVDGVVTEIKYLDCCFFENSYKEHMNTLIESGKSKNDAICETWLKKVLDREEMLVTEE